MMRKELKLPDVGEGVAEGEVLKWLVQEGAQVEDGQSLVEIMTDKVNVEIPSPMKGKIEKILAKEGSTVNVGGPLAIIATEGEEAEAPQEPAKPEAPPRSLLATPATRRLAQELGVELTHIEGTGPGGRITDEDVRQYAHGATPVEISASPELAKLEERIPLHGLRKRIAERMTLAARNIAIVTHTDEADVTELVKARDELKLQAEARNIKLTYLPFIVKSTAEVLKRYPLLNASMDDRANEIILKKYCNIGIAVDTAEGLIVPVLKDADRKSLFQLAAEIDDLSRRARDGELKIENIRGGTFTITNIGAIGGLMGTPIVNYPECAILAPFKIQKRPIVTDGEVRLRDMMYLSLSFDHRILDGAMAARFMNELITALADRRQLLSRVE